MEQGLLHLYWGDGKGKTTAAMGLALRALGSGKRVVIVQFLKGGNSGEIPLLAQLGAEIYRGKAGQKFVFQMTPEEKAATRELQNQNLAAAIAQPADLLILDEAGSAEELDMVDVDLLKKAVLERPAAAPVDAGRRRLLHRDEMPPPPLPEGDKSTKGDRILTPQHHLPADIERTSFHIITEELEMMGLTPPPEHEAVVKRVIHTTADFDYARNLHFTPRAVEQAVKALHAGAVIVTDTNMALAGITKPGLAKLGGTACCYMADPEVAAAAKEAGTTRAVAAMKKAAQEHPGAILAVGNAPTALLTIAEQIESGLRPALVIGVPVGFVNVVESKERLFAVCEKHDVPAIVAMGRKGGSNVAAAICNALIYSAAEMLDPSARGWK